MKLKYIFFGILLLALPKVHAQISNDVQETLGQIIEHAEEASLYRDLVDWDTLKPNIYELSKNASSILDLSPALKYMLKSLGDEHGRIFHNNQIIANYYSSTPKAHLKSFEADIYNKIQMGQTYTFYASMLKNNIGYVRIVGLPMGDNIKMASEIQNEVCRLVKEGAEKWIIDLRYNGGGNMHPMAEGIASIIGEGQVGGSQGLTANESSIWKVDGYNFYYDDFSIGLKEGCSIDESPKVAVLTSVYTASSGEAIAVMFKGHKNSRFFGQKTLGMITVTDWHVINDNTAMTISVSYYKDQNKFVYYNYVDVDIECPFEETPLSTNDKCLNEAISWLIEE